MYVRDKIYYGKNKETNKKNENRSKQKKKEAKMVEEFPIPPIKNITSGMNEACSTSVQV